MRPDRLGTADRTAIDDEEGEPAGISDGTRREAVLGTLQLSNSGMTLVFTSLAVSRFTQDATGASLKKIIMSQRPLREFTGRVGRQGTTIETEVTGDAREIAGEMLPDRFPGH